MKQEFFFCGWAQRKWKVKCYRCNAFCFWKACEAASARQAQRSYPQERRSREPRILPRLCLFSGHYWSGNVLLVCIISSFLVKRKHIRFTHGVILARWWLQSDTWHRNDTHARSHFEWDINVFCWWKKVHIQRCRHNSPSTRHWSGSQPLSDSPSIIFVFPDWVLRELSLNH